MSRPSFPRQEHALVLRQRIAARLQSGPQSLELAERGLDHYRCCYRFGIRRPVDPGWAELPVHFQVAERLEASGSAEELDRILDQFLERHFARNEARDD